MAKIANTVTSHDIVGQREDLEDVIYNIDPTDTVFMSNAGRGSVKSTFHEWQQDKLAAPDTANRKPQGDDVGAFPAHVPTTRLGNYTQISRKEVIVAGTTEAVDKAGRKSQLGYDLAKKAKELRIDIESMLLENVGASAGDTSTASVTASLVAFIKTNTNHATGGTPSGADPVYTTLPTARTDDSVLRTFVETQLQDVVAKCWTSGGAPKTVLVGASNKQKASKFAGIATQYRNNSGTEQATIIGAADVYVSDFGVLSIVPSRFQRARDVFVLDFSHISVNYLRPFKQEPLAKTGDAEKRMILAEYMLQVKAEKALGGIYDLN